MINIRYIEILFLCLLTVCSHAQIKGRLCNCPQNAPSELAEPDTIFHFSNGMDIGLCGYKEIDKKTNEVLFLEFSLFVCGQDSILTGGGWFLQNSKIKKYGDTLILLDCPYLPTGDKFEERETPWIIEKIYFIKGRVKVEKVVNRNIRKYSQEEIQFVLHEYEKIKSSYSNLNDSTVGIVYKLFVAIISGSGKARDYFNDVPLKFKGLDTIYGEIYSDLQYKLSQWDKK